MIANLVNNTGNTSVDLAVTGVDFPVWSGTLSAEWSTATLSNPKNWVLNSSSATPTDFLPNDRVLFNDSATRTTIDISSGDVTPARVLFENSTKNFTLTGTNGIAGPINFTKNGTGTVAVNNTNSFTGSVFLNAGTVQVPVLANAGVNSPLGAGTDITFNGGTLEYTGATAGTTDRPLVFNTNGGSFKNTSAVTLSGPLSGAGTFTKVGSGPLILTSTTNTQAATVIASGAVLQLGDGGVAGSAGLGPITDNGQLILNHSNNATFTNEISGSGSLSKLGTGTATLGGTTANTYAGTTTVSEGILLAGKTAGVTAISGNLDIQAGGTFRLSADDQIADTASVTINGGIFGDPTIAAPANPGPIDTISNLTLNGGSFGSNRSTTGFTITGLMKVTAGTAVVQRGGIVRADAVNISGGAVNLDGGSTTAGQESKLEVGPNGLTLTGGTINFNTGPSAITATSQGSLVVLNGNLNSSGTSSLVRQNAATAGPKAVVDLGGGDRTFNVTDTLSLGTTAAPIGLANGNLIKSGPGTLVLPRHQRSVYWQHHG
jgi:autotransporter-associated beta strand protein